MEIGCSKLQTKDNRSSKQLVTDHNSCNESHGTGCPYCWVPSASVLRLRNTLCYMRPSTPCGFNARLRVTGNRLLLCCHKLAKQPAAGITGCQSSLLLCTHPSSSAQATQHVGGDNILRCFYCCWMGCTTLSVLAVRMKYTAAITPATAIR